MKAAEEAAAVRLQKELLMEKDKEITEEIRREAEEESLAGLKAAEAEAEEAEAVACGYWHLWRYNPDLEAEGKNPFSLDSKEPKWEGFQDFLKGEVRYASVFKQYPDEAQDLFDAAEAMAKKRYASYVRMSKMDWSQEE